MTDARFTTDGGPTLVLTGDGPAPTGVSLDGPRARVAGTVEDRRAVLQYQVRDGCTDVLAHAFCLPRARRFQSVGGSTATSR